MALASRNIMINKKTGPLRQNNFNLIRFVLASLVIISHCQEIVHKDKNKEWLIQIFGTLSFGDVAVKCFFVLSGYLIVKSWIQKPNYSTYLRNRIFRIYPGFLGVSLICAAIVGPLAGNPNYLESFQLMPWVKSVITLQYPVLPPVFEGSHYPMVNGSIWSINYEFKCYLLVIACAVLGLLKFRAGWGIMTIALLASYFLAPLVIQQHPELQPKVRALNLALIFAIGGCFLLVRRVPEGVTRDHYRFAGCLDILHDHEKIRRNRNGFIFRSSATDLRQHALQKPGRLQ